MMVIITYEVNLSVVYNKHAYQVAVPVEVAVRIKIQYESAVLEFIITVSKI